MTTDFSVLMTGCQKTTCSQPEVGGGGLSIHGPQIQKVVGYSLSTLGSMLMVTCNVLKFDEKMTPY